MAFVLAGPDAIGDAEGPCRCPDDAAKAAAQANLDAVSQCRKLLKMGALDFAGAPCPYHAGIAVWSVA